MALPTINGTGVARPRCAVYARVSTGQQSPEMQLVDLRRYAAARGFEVVGEFVDAGWSGAKEHRPELDQLMSAARRREFDAVLVWRFDRFARSVRHLVQALDEFRHLGVSFLSYQENIDTSSPMGNAMFQIIAAMAELERNLIRERVKAGVENARRKGRRLGRPPVVVDMKQANELIAKGLSVSRAASALRVGKATLFRRLRDARVK